MTPEEERTLLDEIAARIEAAVLRGQDEFDQQRSALGSGRAGEAAERVLRTLNAQFAALLAEGLTRATEEPVSIADVLARPIGDDPLRDALDERARRIAEGVAATEAEHRAAFDAVRDEARRLYESYPFALDDE